jgi:hypothetical protein
VTGWIHRHGVNLDAQKSGVDQDLSRGIELGDKAALGKSAIMKFRLYARGAVEGARCGRKVRGARGTRNVDVAMAIQPDAPDAGIRREGIAILVLAGGAAQMRGVDQYWINGDRKIAVVFSQSDAQPVLDDVSAKRSSPSKRSTIRCGSDPGASTKSCSTCLSRP